MLHRLDRLLLHPWLTRASSAVFLVGAIAFIIRAAEAGMRDVGLVEVIGLALMATGLIMFSLGWREQHRQPPERHGTETREPEMPEAPSAAWTPPPDPPGTVLRKAMEGAPRVEFANRLARLHGEGREIRQRAKPDRPTPMEAMTTIRLMFKYPHVSVGLERRAVEWSESVRNQLALSAPRFVPEWEAGPPAPPGPPPFLMSHMTADGVALVAFLDARLGLLENIIRDVRRGS